MTGPVCGSGGVAVESIAGPEGGSHVRVRVRIGHAGADDGLLGEMRASPPPERRMPWRDRESRAWAIRQLERGPYPGMSEDEQRAALDHVRETGFYD